jgi:hypothetical protein
MCYIESENENSFSKRRNQLFRKITSRQREPEDQTVDPTDVSAESPGGADIVPEHFD